LTGSKPQEWLDVADAIGQLRDQLSKAREAAVRAASRGEDVLFTVGKAQVELAVEARRELDGRVGFKVWVAEVGGQGSISSGSSHRLHLELLPHDQAGGSIDVSGRVATPPDR
jgi:hypothetical protein